MTKICFVNLVGGCLFLILSLCSLGAVSAEPADPVFPSAIVKLPENENAILVEKKNQKLFVYTNDGQMISLKFEAPCSTGEVGGVKKEAGDKKTPEGIYFLIDEYEDKYLSPIYGQKAFPTDYPNLLDKRAGKNGSAIWIHGTNKKLIPMDSNGCVALENENILQLSEYVNLNTTPVIMAEQIGMVNQETLLSWQEGIEPVLDLWSDSLLTGTYHDYLSFYSADYFPDISWWESWLKLRKRALKSEIIIGLTREKTGIYFFDQVFVTVFDISLSAGDKVIYLGKQKLFLKSVDGEYQIVGDTFQYIPEQLSQHSDVLVAAARMVITPQWTDKTVVKMLNQWLTAWSSKKMDLYASFYDDDFHSDGMNKKTWVQRKKNLARKYTYIQVTGKDFKVKQGENVCEVIFFQDYESSGLTTQGTKKLKLVKKGGLWKISQESWKEK